MKNLFTITAFIFILAFSNSYSQIAGEFFTAKSGYSAALDEASSMLQSPELIFIGTTNGTEGESGMGISYKTTTGEANAWIYVFREAEEPEIIAGVFVIKAFMFVPFLIEDIDFLEELPIDADFALTAIEWIDSDEANVEFLKCSHYANFVSETPIPENLEIALFNNQFYSEMSDGEPFWALSITTDDDSEIMVAAHAVTKELFCEIFSSINENINVTNTIEIQHYGNNVKVLAKDAAHQDVILSVYSVDGTQIYNHTFSNVSGEFDVFVPFDSFTSGSFYIIAKSKNSYGIKPITIVK